MNEKQMKALPKGDYLNSDLAKIDPSHCRPQLGKPKTGFVNIGTLKKPIYISYLMNRKQRRKEKV